ncbi:MAG: glycosyltransferase family 39 protein [Candidatus Bathyarchaeota archaeon]|nr:MAG: glycosyltransferase family 39 protein [Candidatus Bathyarchaeota archaeon]
MWRVLLSLFILFANGKATLFFLNKFEPKEKFSHTEALLYSFSLGYAVLTIIGISLAQFGLLISAISLLVISIIPLLALCLWIYRKQEENLRRTYNLLREDQSNYKLSLSKGAKDLFSLISLSNIILILIFFIGLALRLETQLTVQWLGDQDPYYHLSFIDSIAIEGSLPSRTFWGFYSYPPSFHVVFALLISTIQVDRYLLLKIVPEFLGFLCIPAVYALIKRKHGEWAGITSAAFLAISSFHIYRTNIAIPEPIALLAMLMFFHAITTQKDPKRYLLAGFFASMVFLTNVLSILYFLPCVIAIFSGSLIFRRWSDALGYLKAVFVGLIFSGTFWLPTFQSLGWSGILEGLGPSYPYGAIFFTSHTYFSWIGWGACILALIGMYVCVRDFKNNLVLLIPTMFFLVLIEAANNGYLIFEANVLFRGLLYFGTWIALLAGVGFARVMQTKRKKIALTTLAVMIVLTAVSFPVLSGNRYPVNWDYDDADFVYRSYLENYVDIFKNESYRIYSADWAFNYGAFSNVVLDREAPQIGEALLRNDISTVTDLITEYNIKYMIFHYGTQEAEFLVESNLTSIYYENWHTIVLVAK